MDERITFSRPPDQMDKSHWRLSANPSIRVPRPFGPAPLMEDLRRRRRSDRYRFAVFGDTHHSPAFGAIMTLLREMGSDFAIATGDLVDLGGGREGPCHYGKLEAEAGEFLRTLPVWPAIGNHDADSRWDNDVWNGFANFRAFYNLPPCYDFRFRNATFVFLSWMLPDQAEMEWLRERLAARATDHLFVVGHYPLHRCSAIVAGRGNERPVEREVEALLAEHRVTAHLSGHAHVYYRTVRRGVTYLISGGAGNDLSALSDLSDAGADDAWLGREPLGDGYVLHTPNCERTWERPVPFFLLLDVAGREVTGRAVSAEGEVLESFSLGQA